MLELHHYIMVILVGIFATVSYLMYTSLVEDLYPRNFADYPTLETTWIILPTIVPLFIALPSLKLLCVMDEEMNFNCALSEKSLLDGQFLHSLTSKFSQ